MSLRGVNTHASHVHTRSPHKIEDHSLPSFLPSFILFVYFILPSFLYFFLPFFLPSFLPLFYFYIFLISHLSHFSCQLQIS
ncbi:hypothetical protein T492DRAFT_1029045, partial [Pavlovales sp. CCMP2436]